jgi:hypothetical protein
LSPITAVRDISLTFPVLTTIDGGCSIWTQFVDDHEFEVSFSEVNYLCSNMVATFNGIEYTLKQLHFHSPSEHTIDGIYYEAEVCNDFINHINVL